MAVQIQLRNDTSANWTSANPILALGELGIETDTDQFKLGDGATAWSSLAYGGVQGTAGADGTDGADGTNGTDGVDGGFDSTQTIADLSTNYTILAADKGKLFTNSAAVTVTVTGLATGEQVDFIQTNAGKITFAAGAGVTLNSRGGILTTANQYSPASVKCIATNTYVLVGDIGA